MENVNQKNNLTTDDRETSTFEPLFDHIAAQEARRVVPLPQYTEQSPRVAMRVRQGKLNPLTAAVIFGVLALGVFAVFYSVYNQSAANLSIEPARAVEENKSDLVESEPSRQINTETISATPPAGNLPVEQPKARNRNRRDSRTIKEAPVSVGEAILVDDERADEPNAAEFPRRIPYKAVKGKKQEKIMRKIERAERSVEQLKQIFDEFGDN